MFLALKGWHEAYINPADIPEPQILHRPTYVHMYIYIYIQIHISMHKRYIHVCECAVIHACMHTYICMHPLYTCICRKTRVHPARMNICVRSICMYIDIYAYRYVYLFKCTYIYICMCTSIYMYPLYASI